jgi:hypothetical protein
VRYVCTERSRRVQTRAILASLEHVYLCFSLLRGSGKYLKSRDCCFFCGSDDGLDREYNRFNRLEGGVCTMCAPGDQRKSGDAQRERPRIQMRRRGLETVPATKCYDLGRFPTIFCDEGCEPTCLIVEVPQSWSLKVTSRLLLCPVAIGSQCGNSRLRPDR